MFQSLKKYFLNLEAKQGTIKGTVMHFEKAMNAKISVSVICVVVIIYFLLYNLHDCNFNPKLSGQILLLGVC